MQSSHLLSGLERQEQLLRYLEISHRASVAEICERFNISEATTRRDLNILAKTGKIRRTHGGAILTRKSPPELPVYHRMNDLTEVKDRMGLEAARLVQDGETVFLGTGTSTLATARFLTTRKNLTVITNSLVIANYLVDYPDINLVVLGGQLRRSELSLIGYITEKAISELRADKVFIGIHGIDPEQGLTNHYLQETMTDRTILQLSPDITIIADHTKCGRVSTAVVAPITKIKTLITDTETPAEFVESLKSKGIAVIQV